MHSTSVAQIRSLGASDLSALLALYAELHPADAQASPAHYQQTWQTLLADPRLHCFGGFVGEALVSNCSLVIVPNLTRACRPYALIENVITAAAHRGRGYGRALLAHACAHAWAQGCYKVMLMTGRQDEATLRFYQSAGFDRHAKQAFYIAAPE